MNGDPVYRRVVRWAAIAASITLVASIFYFSWIPDPNLWDVRWLPRSIAAWADRHGQLRTAVPFVFLGLILGFPRGIRPKGRLLGLVILWIFLSSMVLLAETGQMLMPKRVFDWLDVCWGSGGGAFGLLCSASARWLLDRIIPGK